jgi:hypothetical protein
VTKQNLRKLIAAAVVLVLLVGGYFTLSSYNQQQAGLEALQEEINKVYVTDVSAGNITAFSYLTSDGTLSFTKDGDNWTYDGDTTIDIDESAITTLLGNLDHLVATQTVAPDSGTDYGFDSPTSTISFTTSSGSTTLTVGMENPVSGDYYVKTDAGDTMYLVASASVTAFSQTVADLTVVPEETASPTPTAES